MAAHLTATTSSAPLRTVRLRRPRPSRTLVVVSLLVAALVASYPQHVADAAHDLCTAGSPEHATCGEALVLLGYP